MDTAHQALDLLYRKMTRDDLTKLTETERRQFRELCHHWAMLASNKQESAAA